MWIRWITGPYFERVPAGPTDPPMYMKIPLIANAVVLWVGLPFAIWCFFIRPWRRERRITLDGMLLRVDGPDVLPGSVAELLQHVVHLQHLAVQPRRLVTAHSGLGVARGTRPQVAEPLLTNAPGYAYGVLLITIVGCWVMRKIKSRWPNISNLRLIAGHLRNRVRLRLRDGGAWSCCRPGFYTYPGAIRAVSFNAGTYYQWPVYEGLMWGGVQTALCCLRFFTDDRGRTIVERGLDRVRGGFVKQQFIRFLAIFAGVSACFFVFYNIPAQWFGMHSDPWPEDHP